MPRPFGAVLVSKDEQSLELESPGMGKIFSYRTVSFLSPPLLVHKQV